MKDLRIIFMGTPDFAVPSLKKLLENGCNVVAVITAPDKPAGRGLKISESDVKKLALAKNLKILQPEKLKRPDFISELQSLNADLQIVVAFRMLPEVVWNMPPMGTINLHGSLLPQYRGAAPINWAIINGEKKTGITTFKLKHEIDTGDILMKKEIEIGETETAGELYDRMKEIGAGLLLKTIQNLAENKLQEIPQATIKSSPAEKMPLQHAPKISNETCEINWKKNTDEIYNLVRGLSPYPAAFTFLKGKKLKIFRAEKQKTEVIKSPGELVSDFKTFLKFVCNDGFISMKELQLEGKKKMDVEDFLRGWRD
ncbi:MAG TPA: methionyl-tRNA formyltransferase [Chitinophagaceae bacterium]|nr:methionyl-tRNA formyltransferase [Chitinophagaceae bacterium]